MIDVVVAHKISAQRGINVRVALLVLAAASISAWRSAARIFNWAKAGRRALWVHRTMTGMTGEAVCW